jgi:hypothetical protein
MARIEIRIVDAATTRQQRAEIPDSMSVAKIIERLISMMTLPVHDNGGRPMRYRLDHVESAKRLRDGETLLSAQVKKGDTLRISAETVAGCRLHQLTVNM